MTKRQDLCLQRRSRSEQSDQRQANQPANISHQPRASPDSTSLASRIEFPTMTGADHIVADTLRAPFDGELLRQHNHRGLAGTVSTAEALASHEETAPTARCDLVERTGCVVAIEQHQRRTDVRKPQCNSAPDAGARAGNDRHLAREINPAHQLPTFALTGLAALT